MDVKRTGTTILECFTLALHASDQPSMTGVDFPRSQGMHDLILIAGREHGQMCNRIHIFKPAQLRYRVLGHTISDGDRVGFEGDKTADLHPAPVSNQSTSARSEPASSTLLTPLSAQYHNFAVVGLMAFGEDPFTIPVFGWVALQISMPTD